MNRAGKALRFVGLIAAVWLVGGAEWPVDAIAGILGGMPCC